MSFLARARWSEDLNLATLLSVVLGISIGLLPVTKSAIPVALSVMGVLLIVKRSISHPPVGMILIIMQYCIIQYSLAFYHTGVLWSEAMQQSYTIVLLCIFPIAYALAWGMWLHKTVIDFILIGLLLSSAILASDYILGWGRVFNACRSAGIAFNPLGPANLILVMGVAVLWHRRYHTNVWDILLVISMFLSIGAFTGARMSFYIFIFMICVMVFCGFLKGLRRFSYTMAASLILGITATIAVDSMANCDFRARIYNHIDLIFNIVSEKISPHIEASFAAHAQTTHGTEKITIELNGQTLVSESDRLAAWIGAVRAIKENWLLGLGIDQEASIASQNSANIVPHAHNQYLSWGVWGGIVSLISSALLLLGGVIKSNRNTSFTLATVSWVLTFLTDSLLSNPTILPTFVVYMLVFTIFFSMRDIKAV